MRRPCGTSIAHHRHRARPVGPLGSDPAIIHPPLVVRFVLDVKSDSEVVIEGTHAFDNFRAHRANFFGCERPLG